MSDTMFCEPYDLLDHEDWQAFEHELRSAFAQRDGLHFEIVLMRMQAQLVHRPEPEHVPGRLTQ